MKRWLVIRPLGRLLSLGLAAAVVSCGADGTGLGNDCTLGACDRPDASVDAGPRDASLPPSGEDGGASDAAAATSRSPLCAVSGCFPGFPGACAPVLLTDAAPSMPAEAAAYELPQQAPGDDASSDEDEGEASVVEGGAAVDADLADGTLAPESAAALDGAALDSAPPLVSDASIADAARGADAARSDSAVRTDASGIDGAFVAQSCYVMPESTGVTAACAPVGPGATGSACHDSRECGAVLACVQIDGSGVCRPFSCALPPSCPAQSFYELAPLVVAGAAPPVSVPVCVPNEPCPLLATPSSCAAGKVCGVVGSLGETSCMVPGTAKQNDWCDEGTRCAEGLVCSLRPNKSDNKCLKLCHVDAAAAECPGGTCQGGNNAIPDGFGICVGDSPDGG